MPEEQPTKNDPILSNLPPPPPLQMSPMILTAAESKYPKKVFVFQHKLLHYY